VLGNHPPLRCRSAPRLGVQRAPCHCGAARRVESLSWRARLASSRHRAIITLVPARPSSSVVNSLRGSSRIPARQSSGRDRLSDQVHAYSREGHHVSVPDPQRTRARGYSALGKMSTLPARPTGSLSPRWNCPAGWWRQRRTPVRGSRRRRQSCSTWVSELLGKQPKRTRVR